MIPFIVIFMGITIYKSKYIDVLNLGDEVSISLGVDVEKQRRRLKNL